MKYTITHTTVYEYSQSVSHCLSETHLLLRNTESQSYSLSEIHVSPEPAEAYERQDVFGNRVSFFRVQQPHQQLVVTSTNEVEISPQQKQSRLIPDISWESALELIKAPIISDKPSTSMLLEAKLFCLESTLARQNHELKHYAAESFSPNRSLHEAISELNQRIYQDFTYDPSFTTVATPLSEVFEHKRGVCQDFAHLAIACIRSIGLPARYVSGYIETLPPPGQKKMAGSDQSHAWFSIYTPDIGWIDFDPTNNCQTNDQHVTVAWGRDYSDVTPLKGVAIGGNEHQVSVSVDMQRKS